MISFNITHDDIRDLNDSDLRELIAELCKSELRARDLSTSFVIWGGSQDAADGGIDIRVALDEICTINGYIPRNNTGFQIKKPKMSPSEIGKEMQPKGELRQSILELIKGKGAYIIVSSTDHLTDQALRNRIEKMRACVQPHDPGEELYIDFYDCRRIADWVNGNANMRLWVQQKLGKELSGWLPHGNWSASPLGGANEYILDDHLSITISNYEENKKSVLDGIQYMRSILSNGGGIVRLVGLSGVGKTRLAEALFDDSLGSNSLDPSRVFYTDAGRGSNPSPLSLARQLIADRVYAILIIDNCSIQLHKTLVDECEMSKTIGLLTIEYDIRENTSISTHVVNLEPSSEETLVKVITRLYSFISEEVARLIAHFAGGNYRLAIALAGTIRSGESRLQLQDEDLFLRLFNQRHGQQYELLAAGEAMSLVYSFDGEDITDSGELAVLAELAGQSTIAMYRSVSELLRRQLVQQRSHWRAVLPHVLANYLAARALENVPKDKILNLLYEPKKTRLLSSFAHRLGFLKYSRMAKEIALQWLQPGDLLGDLASFDYYKSHILINIAPIIPEAVLEKFETALKDGIVIKGYVRNEYVHLIKKIAYSDKYFQQSVRILTMLYTDKNNGNRSDCKFEGLFHAMLSGSHATPETRLACIRELIETGDPQKEELALDLLKASLQSDYFTGSVSPEFGSEARDYGWLPITCGDQINWYTVFAEYILDLYTCGKMDRRKLRKIIADNLNGLISIGATPLVTQIADIVMQTGFWNDGWLCVKHEIHSLEKKNIIVGELNDLERKMQPRTQEDWVRLYAFSKETYLLRRTMNKGRSTFADEVLEAGEQLATDADMLEKLLPEFLCAMNSGNAYNQFALGRGVGAAFKDIDILVDLIVNALNILENEVNYTIPFLNGIMQSIYERDSEKAIGAILLIRTEERFISLYLSLELSLPFNNNSVERLLVYIEKHRSHVKFIDPYMLASCLDKLDDNTALFFLNKLQSYTVNDYISEKLILIQVYIDEKEELSDRFCEFAHEVFLSVKWFESETKSNKKMIEYHMKELAPKCYSVLRDDRLLKLLETIAVNCPTEPFFSFDYCEVLGELSPVRPFLFMDFFYENKVNISQYGIEVLLNMRYLFTKPVLDHIKQQDIFKWCEMDFSNRGLWVARFITPFSYDNENKSITWTWLAKKFILQTPAEDIQMISTLCRSLTPRCWTNSLYEELKRRFQLICWLKETVKGKQLTYVLNLEKEYVERLEQERLSEERENRLLAERFE